MHPLLEEFKTFCEEHTEEEFLEDIQWYDMSIGWFLAKGATIDEAELLSVDARYEHGYWTDKE